MSYLDELERIENEILELEHELKNPRIRGRKRRGLERELDVLRGKYCDFESEIAMQMLRDDDVDVEPFLVGIYDEDTIRADGAPIIEERIPGSRIPWL